MASNKHRRKGGRVYTSMRAYRSTRTCPWRHHRRNLRRPHRGLPHPLRRRNVDTLSMAAPHRAPRVASLARSLNANDIGNEGAQHIAKALEVNRTLQKLECAAA